MVQPVDNRSCQIVVSSPAFAPFPAGCWTGIAPQPDAPKAGLIFRMRIEQAIRSRFFLMVFLVCQAKPALIIARLPAPDLSIQSSI